MKPKKYKLIKSNSEEYECADISEVLDYFEFDFKEDNIISIDSHEIKLENKLSDLIFIYKNGKYEDVNHTMEDFFNNTIIKVVPNIKLIKL